MPYAILSYKQSGFVLLLLSLLSCSSWGGLSNPLATEDPFNLVDAKQVATIYHDANDAQLVARAAGLFADDIQRVTGREATLSTSRASLEGQVVIVGTLGQSAIIAELAAKYPKLREIEGDWERYAILTLDKPFPGVDQALVIAGSDRRGAAYGLMDLSEKIGVSPWYWWADVPVEKKETLLLKQEDYVSKRPSVKYRGIFLNDEAPALRGWAEETFGGFNHAFYEKVFELLLRQKANYLWPAMWPPSAFADDDAENARLAHEYGIVISTSHHEPMMRAHAEWGRYEGGAWNYETNKEKLQAFWRGGIERMGDYESVVTLGMRGDGDEAMSEETAVDLLQVIIKDQREILKEVTGKPLSEIPQVWALYKEVQDYYDKGMRVDEDIMLLFCDDNWGNVRILPKKEERDYPGGFGMYYHFDFVGGPVSYRWLNVTQIEKVWEQLNLTYSWGVKDLWLVNVGDLKPMELPISFFLDFAWDTEAIRAADLPNYYEEWATQQFGPEHATEIADILALYTKYNGRRTPEMITPQTYSLVHYREAERVLADYQSLLKRSEALYDKLPAAQRDAFYQLVLSPVSLCSNLYEMYIAAGKNEVYALQGWAAANYYADKVKACFERDAELTRYYHEDLADGKWNHIMAQTHMGYTSWNHPPANRMPAVSYVQVPQEAGLAVVAEQGAAEDWSGAAEVDRSWSRQAFAPFDPVNDQGYYLALFNRGATPLDYQLSTEEEWIKLSKRSGRLDYADKVYVSIDWAKAPTGRAIGEVVVSAPNSRPQRVQVPLRNDLPAVRGFVENNGVISIEAAHYTDKKDAENIHWATVPNLGRTEDAVTILPADADVQQPGAGAPYLEYTFTTLTDADLELMSYLSPTLNYKKGEGLKFAVAIDGEEPQIVNMHAGETTPDWEYPKWWNDSVTDHIKVKRTTHSSVSAGTHTLRVWMVDPGVVFQKFVLDAGGLMPSYLGPPESKVVDTK